MNGHPVGEWSVNSSGIHEFNYHDSWLDSDLCRPLSLSLPLRPYNQKYKGPIVESFFDNLLPDSLQIRRRIQARFHKKTTQAFDLLEEIGRDCVGAIQLLPPEIKNADIYKITGKDVNKNEIENILMAVAGADHRYTFNNEDFRISIAGVQEKTTFLKYKGKWKIPTGTTPSTHIFKLPIGQAHLIDMSSSVENEWLCSKIIRAFDMPVAGNEILYFGGQKVLVVERFDRKLSGDGGWITRIPQEDFCQATGTSPALKYEIDGGPGIEKIMGILLGSSNYENDRKNFFKSQILFWLLAAPDGHAKNFSIYLKSGGEFSLTPLYDVLSAYPAMGKSQNQIPLKKLKMAMSVYGKNKNYHWYKISYRYWMEMGNRCGISEKTVKTMIEEIIDKFPGVKDSVTSLIPKDFPENSARSIFKGIGDSITKLKKEVS